MLQWHEHTHATGRRIDSPGERDHQQRPVIVRQGYGDTCSRHQARGGEQQPTDIVARAEKPDGNRQERRAKEGRGRDDADLRRGKAEEEQIDRKEDDDKAVAEIAQGTRSKQIGARVDA